MHKKTIDYALTTFAAVNLCLTWLIYHNSVLPGKLPFGY